MKRTELLGVMLRVIGVWHLVNLLLPLTQVLRYLKPFDNPHELLQMLGLMFGFEVIPLFGSISFILATGWFVRIAYPNADPIAEAAVSADENPRLQAQQLLGAMLKALGYWKMLDALTRVPVLGNGWLSIWNSDLLSGFTSTMVGSLLAESIEIAAAVCMIRGTDWLVRIAYRREESPLQTSAPSGSTPRQRARETFAALLRALGYWELLGGMTRLPMQLSWFATRPFPSEILKMEPRETWEGLAYTGLSIAAGLFLLVATDWIAACAYRRRDTEPGTHAKAAEPA